MLAQKALGGNTEAWDRLYKGTYTTVCRYVRRIYIKQYIEYDQLVDIISESFARCYKNLNSYLGLSRFSTWVCGFARYVLLEHYYKYVRRQKTIHYISISSEIYRTASTPESIIIKREQDMCIRTAFYSLSLRHRMLLRCYVLREISPKHIMYKTGMPYHKTRKEELDDAIRILRRRYLALYEKRKVPPD